MSLTLPEMIGLSIGISTAVMFLMGIAVWIHQRRRSKKGRPEGRGDPPRPLGYRNELPGEDQRFEIDGRLKWSELQDKGCAHELCAEDTPIELPVGVTVLDQSDDGFKGSSGKAT